MNPADNLVGQTVNGEWEVIEKVQRPPNATGGMFSIGYIVRAADGRKAFLKALDFSKAFRAPDPARAFQAMTEAFNFERDVLAKCREKRLSRVVTALAEGRIDVTGGSYPVQFLLFDLAESDIRSHPKAARSFDLAWTLRSLHHIAVGLSQLHGNDIAHQDLKPSNVLVFQKDEMKLADLGRAEQKGSACPTSSLVVAGAKSYAPPELLYGEANPDWNCRRLGCDLYLMGSMVVFFFCGIQMTAILKSELNPAHTWTRWSGGYRVALPYVRDAFGRAIEVVRRAVPTDVHDPILSVIAELCEPDPLLRGHPANRMGHANQFSLERYVSLFNRLGKRAELGLLGAVR